MPDLKCTVNECQHNCDTRCSLGHIDVGGKEATVSRSTCCESFAPKKNTASTCREQPKTTAAIDCSAGNCVYNQAHHCQAQTVSVEGSGCDTCGETACATFHCR